MYNSQGGNSQPHVGATFIPGGLDDFYMPEVVSPLPQRSMPEVPQQIQDNLAHLELEADAASELDSTPRSQALATYSSSSSHERQASYSSNPYGGQSQAQTTGGTNTDIRANGRRNSPRGVSPRRNSPRKYSPPLDDIEQPSFSPFPKVPDRPANVPPSDEENEAKLESARVAVLNSNDPEMQLAWAQDTLQHVEICQQNESRLSELRDARAMTPRIEHQLRVDAVNVVNFLADQHHPKAEFIKGMWLEFGKFGYRMDKKEAYRCYYRAAQGGYARAEYRIGMQFEYSNDIGKAIRHYQKGVELGDSASNYRLGMMTLQGTHGQVQDFQQGIDLIKFAAETADENAPQGAYMYGMLQARELPQLKVPEQYLPPKESALYNIEKAAYLGFAKAQTRMGAAYELCQLGCEFDPILSLHYNSLAARQGDAEAEMAISKWFLCGFDDLFKPNEELAYKYAERAAQTGLPTAEFAMGYFNEVGINVPVNLKKAREWYTKAADHGNKDAAARVEGIARSKTLSRKDHEQVALSKIRATRRGNRPERFKMPDVPTTTRMPDVPTTTPMPGVPVVMPVPPSTNGRAYYHSQANQNPYPTAAPVLPYAGAAYNSAGAPPVGYSPNPANYPPNPANYPPNPAARPISAAPIGGPPPVAQYGPLPPSRMPQRPYSSTPPQGYGVGRGVPLPNQALPAQTPQYYRRPPGGAPPNLAPPNVAPQNLAPPVPAKTPVPQSERPQAERIPTAPPAVNDPRQRLPVTLSERPQPERTPTAPPVANDPRQRPLSHIELGFSAPPDFSGADKKKLPRRSDNPAAAYPTTGKSYTPYPERVSSRPAAASQAPAQTNTSRPQNPPYPPTGAAAVAAHTPSQESAPPKRPLPNVYARKDSTPAYPVEDNIPVPPTVSNGGGRKPGPGATSFEEMGVPLQKKHDDCVVM